MKNIYQTFFIFSLIFSLNVNAFSQENYLDAKVLSLNDDTLTGYINYQEWERNPKTIKFKSSRESEFIEYSPGDIQAFWVGNDYYLSRNITVTESPRKPEQLTYEKEKTSKNITAFILVLVSGEASLYEYVDEMSVERYYAKKKGGELYELIYYKYYTQQYGARMITENRKYGGQLIYLFQDCEEIKKDIGSATYKASDLSKVVEKYNLCINSENEYVRVEKRNKMRFGVLGGVSISMIKFDNIPISYHFDASEMKPSICPTIGFTFELKMPRSRGKWSWYNDIIIKRHRFRTNSTTKVTEDYFTEYTSTLEATYLKLNSMARFHIVGHKVIPYFGAGLFFAKTITSKSERVQETHFGGEVTTRTTEIFDPFGYDYGIAAAVGIKFKDFHFEGRYDFGLVPGYGSLSSNTHSVYLLFGYTF